MGKLNEKLKDFDETELLREIMARNCYGLDGPSEVKFVSQHKAVTVGIGKDHTASVYLDVDAIDELDKYNGASEHTINNQQITAAEAIYGFVSWLTTREEPTVMSSNDNAAPAAERIKEFLESNKIDDSRVDFSLMAKM
jgi:hypothetical protein